MKHFPSVGLIFVLIMIAFGAGAYFLIDSVLGDYEDYKTYKDFCNARPSFCYCEWLDCEFKTRWSSVDGFSNDTKELCKLAKELGDKKTLFRVGCEK
jgi:hypothetical protein